MLFNNSDDAIYMIQISKGFPLVHCRVKGGYISKRDFQDLAELLQWISV